MTTEEKAKAYDETIEKLRDFYRDYNTISCLIDVKEELASLFPELAKSEDERIRKEILKFVTIVADSKSNKMEWIAWLEKQGEQKSKWSEEDEHHWMMCIECVEECATQEREDFSKTIDWLKSLKKREDKL